MSRDITVVSEGDLNRLTRTFAAPGLQGLHSQAPGIRSFIDAEQCQFHTVRRGRCTTVVHA
jgi:hypothetical protein